MIVNALSENGLIDPEMFYESPFTDIDDQGIVGVFGVEKAKEIISIVRRLNAAVAA
jgi:type I restriction enzyme R subunit